ncbi:hypothetical protein BKA67DRAFT_658732 [Truncatella angustata]|uniref:Uncharacterized protein n=1 Tax=Truncatella angustata TaxID=152316 RepID=A0A9P8ULL5_9PEZI|nr:uncharacterized protein BKA67DRAFT_658732 [Truncatella angustata]KAH6654433.1 hypothetical protein BKA67DRAFT_658732 [Truncatella angustata]
MAAGNLTVEIHGSNESKSEFRTQDSAHEEVNAVSTQGVMEPYSVYDKRQKRILAAVLGVASLASPPIACIYLPLFPLLQTQYVSSAQTISHRRRLVSLAAYAIFTLGSLGLVFNDIGPVLGGLITWCTGSAAWVFAALMVLATFGECLEQKLRLFTFVMYVDNADEEEPGTRI